MPRPYRSRRNPAPLIALLAIVLLAGGVAVALLGGGGGSSNSSTSAKAKQQRAERRQRRAQRNQQTTPAPSGQQSGPYTVPQPTGSSPQTGASLQQQGHSLILANQYDQAIPILERAVQAFPAGTTDLNYAYALYDLGNALHLAGRPKDAIPVLEERLKIDNQRDAVQRELDAARADAGQ
jgi:serine/threonine-protein kinase